MLVCEGKSLEEVIAAKPTASSIRRSRECQTAERFIRWLTPK